MNATQGTILIMIGALALWLTWSAKSPFGQTGLQKQIDDAYKQGQQDSADIIAKKSGQWPTGSDHTSPDAKDRNHDTGIDGADLSKIGTPLICSALGGTWDYATNECVRKH